MDAFLADTNKLSMMNLVVLSLIFIFKLYQRQQCIKCVKNVSFGSRQALELNLESELAKTHAQ